MRAALGRRFGMNPKIEVRAPEEIADLPSGSLDVALHSVAQYLTPKELDELLVLFRRLLGANGVLILGDTSFRHMSRRWRRRCASAFCRAAQISRRRAELAFGRTFAPTTGACAQIPASPATPARGDGEADCRRIFAAARAGEYRVTTPPA